MTMHHQATGPRELARHLRGSVVLPGDRDWDTARQPWNLRIDQRPAAVVVAEGADDMAVTAAFAARHGLRVTAQSTGHGAGQALDDTIVLRTGRLRDITVDPANGAATVGAGVRCDELANAISPHGLAASVGLAPDIGVVGFAMFGGAGILGRWLGFAAHQVMAADVVTADGTRLVCDAANHPDLLWALRGGGGGFALVSRVHLRLARPAAMFGGQIVWPVEAAADVFGMWRDWMTSVPAEMTSDVSIIELPPLPEVPEVLRGQRVTVVTACHAGPADEGAALIGRLTGAGTHMFSGCRPLATADLPTLAGIPAAPRPSRVRAELLAGLPDAAMSEVIRRASDPASPVVVADIRQLGGAYASEHAERPSAVPPTDARYLIELVSMAPDADADATAMAYQQELCATLAPWTTGTILPSFADAGEHERRVYPPEITQRLSSVKRRYDPANTLLASFPC